MIATDLFWLLPWALFALLGLFIAIGIPIAFALIASAVAITVLDPRLSHWIVFQRMYNGMDSFVLLAVPIFLLAGNLINQAEITDRLIRFAMNLLGRFKGALAHVNVAVSMMFAGVSGSSTADSAGVGSMLIPSMKREGYPTEFAVAVTAASSLIGIIIPPSINMIVWGALSLFSLVAASIFGYLISFYEVPNTLMGGIALTDPVTLMVVMTLVMLLIGTFMDSLPAMAIIAPLFLPLALQAGIHPVHFGIVGDLALGLLLSASRRITEGDRFVRAEQWPGGKLGLGWSLRGRKLGILDYGRIGQEIARLAQAFDMAIFYCGPTPKPQLTGTFIAHPVELAQHVDALIVACAGGPATAGLVNRDVMRALGPAGLLVNVARGSVVDEPALVAATASMWRSMPQCHVRAGSGPGISSAPAAGPALSSLSPGAKSSPVSRGSAMPGSASAAERLRHRLRRLMRPCPAFFFTRLAICHKHA